MKNWRPWKGPDGEGATRHSRCVLVERRALTSPPSPSPPFLCRADDMLATVSVDAYSFPSGHTTRCVMLACLAPWLSVPVVRGELEARVSGKVGQLKTQLDVV